jgi:ATP/maltotriose-dependent transcriptional regulator MalT
MSRPNRQVEYSVLLRLKSQRPRLARKRILVSAPAGYGKATALSPWPWHGHWDGACYH